VLRKERLPFVTAGKRRPFLAGADSDYRKKQLFAADKNFLLSAGADCREESAAGAGDRSFPSLAVYDCRGQRGAAGRRAGKLFPAGRQHSSETGYRAGWASSASTSLSKEGFIKFRENCANL